MKQALTWIVFNGVFAGILVSGFYYEIEGLQNIAFVFAWIIIVISFFAPSSAEKKGKKHPIWRPIRIFSDLFIISVFAFYGAIFTAAFLFIHVVFVEEAIRITEENPTEEGND